MNIKAPFLTGFSSKLFGSAKRSEQELIAKKRADLLDGSLELQHMFVDEIPPELLKEHSDTERIRMYPDHLVFWAFLGQVLSDGGSCAEAVTQIQTWAREQGLPIPKTNTASYCNARKDLPLKLLEKVDESLNRQLQSLLGYDKEWRGLRPVAEDGTTAQLPDTKANREKYPYPKGQSEGCGFPVVRINALMDLSHGGLRALATSSLEESELKLHDELATHLSEGDVLIADRYYSGYALISELQAKGVHFIGRTHASRKIDFKKGKKLGPDERLFVWEKPKKIPPQERMSQERWDAIPQTLTVRIIRCKGPDREGKMTTRYMVTTLIDPKKYPADEILSLYYHRWEIEVRFRDIKSTLGMEMLKTKSPEMAMKELLMHQILYNLMRLLMLKAGITHNKNHRRFSFRGVQQVIQSSRQTFRGLANFPKKHARLIAAIWEAVTERVVKERPGRSEPRRVKRRPKSSRWLQRPRQQYFEHFRSDYHPRKILDEAA